MDPERQPITPLLDRIQHPAELKKLGLGDLPMLAAELREVIQDTVQYTGGHLGSGMGVVELSIALHYVFDFSEDRLVFDVGHQAYPHKILTGRRDRFHTLRQKGGLSGFTNRFESIYDVYTMGHAGTATSAALGIALGDQRQGRERHCVSVVGDASMGAGIAFEALNHAGSLEDTRMLVILNDNRWSIAKTIGALSRYLDRVRSGQLYHRAKDNLHSLLKAIPLVGKDLDEKFDQAVDQVRKIVVPGHVFEELGLNYFGPIDGHDTQALVDYLKRVKDLDGVTLLHVRTNKGHGVPGSESRYDRAHAAKPSPRPASKPKPELVKQEPECVLPAKAAKKSKSWTEWFADAVDNLAQDDERVVALTAAMPDGTGLMKFGEKYPERFFDVGIAEQHCVGLASGLATSGMRPIAAIYSTFLQRAYDILFQEVVVQDLPVIFAIDRAGLVGEDGISHHGLFDIAYLRTFPRMTIMAPKDGVELEQMMRLANTLDGPSAIRYPRGSAPQPLGDADRRDVLPLGRSEVVREGADGAILACGHMVKTALDAASLLAEQGLSIEVVNARFVKPLDEKGILELCERHDRVLTLEDHAIMGGFGSAVLEMLATHPPVRARVELAGVRDQFVEHGSRSELLAEVGLDAQSIAARFLSKRPATTAR